jgi:hypothetical protein
MCVYVCGWENKNFHKLDAVIGCEVGCNYLYELIYYSVCVYALAFLCCVLGPVGKFFTTEIVIMPFVVIHVFS